MLQTLREDEIAIGPIVRVFAAGMRDCANSAAPTCQDTSEDIKAKQPGSLGRRSLRTLHCKMGARSLGVVARTALLHLVNALFKVSHIIPVQRLQLNISDR